MTMPATREPCPSVATARRSLANSFRRHGLATPELDARLLLRLGRGLEADGTPGERICPDVDGDAERPAR